MNTPRQTRLLALAAAGLLACGFGAGCAGLPRIDPSGNRLLIWPKDEPQQAVISNPTAAPVYSTPGLPATAPPVLTAPPAGAPSTAPLVGPTGAPQAMTAGMVGAPRDVLTMTPERILAPVGSEVVLKSSICTGDGYTLADQKIEWMLGRNGVGQFVELGGKGLMHPAWLPWNQPKKVDNYYAVGYTATGPLCVTRGTEDPTDDVEINRGDAWVSVHSPVEGTSYVTSYAQQVPGWGDRRATATIYWVDVQWVFPPATVSSSGRPETLTTTVTRQTDGTPLEGWIVRYEVDDGAAGGQPSQTADVRTGPDGRASVEVSPTASGAASSLIRTTLIRPARFAGGDQPELVIAKGQSQIDWTGEAPYVPGDGGLTPIPGTTPPVTGPVDPGTATPIPQVPPAPARKPRLEVEIVRDSPATGDVAVGQQVRSLVTVRNLGDAVATNVRLNVKFAPGLSHLSDTDNAHEINSDDMGPIAPGGVSQPLALTFDVVKAGALEYHVTASCAEGSVQSAGAKVNAKPAPQEALPGLRVTKDGPLQAIVGETTPFIVTVRNTGDTTLTNITIVDEYQAQLRPKPPTPDAEIVQGALRWVIPQLRPGETKRFDIDVYCADQSLRAMTKVEATAQTASGLIRNADEHSIEIKPATGTPPAAGGGPPPAGADSPLRIRVAPNDATVRATTRTIINVRVQNASAVPDSQVRVLVLFPPELTPDLTAIQPTDGVRAQAVQGGIEFTPIVEARPNEMFDFQIPVNANRPGVVTVVAKALSTRVPRPVEHSATIEIISP